MFVTVLCIGIGNALMGLSTLLVRRGELRFGFIPLSWLILLTLQELNLFWYTLEILAVEEWAFAGFLYMLAGPILLTLATSLMVPDPSRGDRDDPMERYLSVARAFFVIMVLLMLWMVGVDILIGDGFSAAGVWNLAEAAVFTILAASRRRRVHVAGTVAVWAIFLSLLIVSGLGLVD